MSTQTPEPCPFCGAVPIPHDGDLIVAHLPECFFTQHYAQEMWLIGKRRRSQWNARHQLAQSVNRELLEALKGLKAACVDVLIPSINQAIEGGFKMETWTAEQMQFAHAVQDTDAAIHRAESATDTRRRQG